MSLGAPLLISGRYAKRSSSMATAADMTMAATRATRSMGKASPRLWFTRSVPCRKMKVHATAKVPYMKTSEWAKLMSCSTP